MIGHIEDFGMSAFISDALLTAANHLLHLSSHSWATRTGHVASTVSTAGLGVQHLIDIHSWQLLNEP